MWCMVSHVKDPVVDSLSGRTRYVRLSFHWEQKVYKCKWNITLDSWGLWRIFAHIIGPYICDFKNKILTNTSKWVVKARLLKFNKLQKENFTNLWSYSDFVCWYLSKPGNYINYVGICFYSAKLILWILFFNQIYSFYLKKTLKNHYLLIFQKRIHKRKFNYKLSLKIADYNTEHSLA